MESARPLSPSPKEDPLKRSLLPDILTTEDVAAHLRVSVQRAREHIRAGLLGPYSRIGRRYYLRREGVLHALEACETTPVPRVAPVPAPLPPASRRILDLLAGGRRRGEEDADE